MERPDVIIVGAGLSGLVAASEAVERGRKVLMLDQEGPQSLGGQAHWSLGGLFMVDTPEQRRMGIRDSAALATMDWAGSAQFDRAEDDTSRAFADAFLDFAGGEMRPWLHGLGLRWFPVVGWAERGGSGAGAGNSVPRFHITWGTGPGVLAPFLRRAEEARKNGQLEIRYRHRVVDLLVDQGRVIGVHGDILEDSDKPRGVSTSRTVTGAFELTGEAVVMTSGGIGGNLERVRAVWPVERLGPAPREMISGVPDFVDGKLQAAAEAHGARITNADRMWHYCEGVKNWKPIWPNHGIRVLPGPSPLWFDALGQRLEAPYLPGFDTLGTLKRILSTGHDHSWFILTQKIIEKEFALSGSEQNPDLASGTWRGVLKSRLGKGATKAVEAFKKKGEDFIIADDLETLVQRMTALTPQAPLDAALIRRQIEARDAQMDHAYTKDLQIMAMRNARKYKGDRIFRTARPHKILDPTKGPLIAVRLNIVTRKSLGGLQTNLSGQVLHQDGSVIEGLYAAGEASGFGGGGYHGYNALEGTFLGGCLFSGRQAGKNA